LKHFGENPAVAAPRKNVAAQNNNPSSADRNDACGGLVSVLKTLTRLVISDYFLNEDSFGKVHAEGDHEIHVGVAID
jgi:hypothetical protein